MSDTLLQQVKSMVVSLPPVQQREVRDLIDTLLSTKEVPEWRRDPTEGLYDDLRSKMNFRFDSGLPDSVRALKRIRPQIVARLTEINKAVEQCIAHEFGAINIQEHALVRALLVDTAIFSILSRTGPNDSYPNPERVLDALADPTGLLDQQFPGYRRAGVLKKMVLGYLNRNAMERTDVRDKPSKE